MIDIRRGDKWCIHDIMSTLTPHLDYYTSSCSRIESLDKKLLIDFPIIKEFSFTTEQFVI